MNNKQKVDLTFLEVKEEFKLNTKATFALARTEVMEGIKASFPSNQSPSGN